MNAKQKRSLQVIVAVFWAVIIIVAVLNRDKITVDGIVKMTPKELLPTVVLFLFLYAFKSVTIVVFSGLLYAAGGVILPLWLALPVNIAGTAIMFSVPYWLGRKLGESEVNRLVTKYPKLGELKAFQTKNDFFFAFMVRMIGLLPSDPVSAYMGASGIPYPNYLLGSLLGMLPDMIAYTVMGMNAGNISSPAFLISAGSILLISCCSVIIFARKRQKDRNTKDT